MPPATRTRAQKAKVVGRAEVIGLRPAAREANVAPSSLAYWRASPEFERLRTQKKEDVAADVWAGFQAGVRRIIELLPVTEDMSKVAIATGVLFDKFALMSGEATSRTESRELTEGLNDHERATLRRLLETELAKVKP